MQRDHIGDFINRLVTAARAGKAHVTVSRTTLLERVANALAECGYISVSQKKGHRGEDVLEITILRNEAGTPRIRGAERVSRLSRRIYGGSRARANSRGERGHLIVSTSKGILEFSRAKKAKVGGEFLFRVW